MQERDLGRSLTKLGIELNVIAVLTGPTVEASRQAA